MIQWLLFVMLIERMGLQSKPMILHGYVKKDACNKYGKYCHRNRFFDYH